MADVSQIKIGNTIYTIKSELSKTPTLTSGGFVIPWSPGAIAAHARSSYSDYIPFAGDAKVFTYLLENSTGIDVYDKDKTFIRAITGDGAAWYDISTKNGRYFRLTNDHVYMPDSNVRYCLDFGENYIEAVDITKIIPKTPTLTSGGFVIPWSPGAIAAHARSSYSDYIPFAGDAKVFTYLLENSTGIDVYDKDKTFIRAITGDGAAWYDISTKNGRYFRLTNDHVYMPDSNVRYYIGYENQEDIVDINLLSIQKKIVCCGDSLTWGAVYTGASVVRQAYKSYPDILETITGTTCENIGSSGYSSSDWWSHHNDKLNQDALYIIFLGTNGGLTDTISTDCSGTDPSSFSNTNTGNYGKILQTLKNNDRKAVLIHVYAASDSTVEITNSVIDQFSSRFLYPVIKLDQERENSIYHCYPSGSGSNAVHFNDYGYCWLANDINMNINKLSYTDKINIFPL